MVVEPDFSSLASANQGAAVYATAWRFYETQYDLLRSLRASDFRGQELVDTGSCHCDLISCDDGAEYWFDVTDLLAVVEAGGSRASSVEADAAARGSAPRREDRDLQASRTTVSPRSRGARHREGVGA